MIDFVCALFLILPFVGLFWFSWQIAKIVDFIDKQKSGYFQNGKDHKGQKKHETYNMDNLHIR